MTENLFQKARERISRSLIESYFAVNGSYWKSNSLWTLSPLRSDKSIGSFHISENGTYFDFATGEGGDFIDLLAKARNISTKEAAETIIGETPYSLNKNKPIKSIKPKTVKLNAKHIYPLSEDIINKFAEYAKLEKIQKQFGKYDSGYTIRNVANEVLFFVARYEYTKPKKGKNVIPFYYGDDGKFHAKLPYTDNIPMYGMHKYKDGCKVVIVEGEKKAIVEVPGYVLLSPIGGANKFHLADVRELQTASEVIIFPDNDETGKKAARLIYDNIRNPNKRILDIQSKEEKWDIIDAKNQEYDLIDFIENTPSVKIDKEIIVEPEPEPIDAEPNEPETENNIQPPNEIINHETPLENMFFEFLGWDDDYHYFLKSRERSLMTISKQSFTSSKVLSIAPLDFWVTNNFVNRNGNMNLLMAQDWIQNNSYLKGRFKSDKVRGAGVWVDGHDKIINTGKALFINGKNEIPYSQYRSEYVYVTSDNYFGEIYGQESTDEEGLSLLELFKVQKWTNDQSMYAMLGWTLISNFGGCLKWRPHIYLTGKIGSGKSWLLDNVIKRLIGDYAHYGTAIDTEAGLRRSIMQEPRPVVLDEVKVKNKKDEQNISNIMNLLRNASSDASSRITMASPSGGTITFVMRSPFLISSDQTPFDDDSMKTRILTCELFTPPPSERDKHEHNKKLESNKFIELINKNPDKYRIRVYSRLERIINHTYYLENEILPKIKYFDTARKRSNWAPLLATVMHICYEIPEDDLIQVEEYALTFTAHFTDDSTPVMADEDAIFYALLESQVKISPDDSPTVAEMLVNKNDNEYYRLELERMGIKINRDNELCISTNSDRIRNLLKGKYFSENYDAQLKRNELCKNGNAKTKNVSFTIGNRMCRIFDWDGFQKKYLEKNDE